jgi:hypothetical protein
VILCVAVNKVKVRKLEADSLYNFFLAAGNVAGFGKEAKFQVKTAALEENIVAGNNVASFI